MTSFGIAYLLGATFGELILLAWWLRSQPEGATIRQYVRAKRGDVILSAAVALTLAVAWSEGTLAKPVVDWLGTDLPETLGMSVIAGAVVAVFAHQILGKFASKAGVDTPRE